MGPASATRGAVQVECRLGGVPRPIPVELRMPSSNKSVRRQESPLAAEYPRLDHGSAFVDACLSRTCAPQNQVDTCEPYRLQDRRKIERFITPSTPNCPPRLLPSALSVVCDSSFGWLRAIVGCLVAFIVLDVSAFIALNVMGYTTPGVMLGLISGGLVALLVSGFLVLFLGTRPAVHYSHN